MLKKFLANVEERFKTVDKSFARTLMTKEECEVFSCSSFLKFLASSIWATSI